MARKFNEAQIKDLLLQALETERGGIRLYETALQCTKNPDLQSEFEEYLEQTRRHETVLTALFAQLGLDTETDSPGRQVVAHIGRSLVEAIELARDTDGRDAAEIVACECVVLAETKDHANWELIGRIAAADSGSRAKFLQAAYDEVEEDEDHHLYHTKGFCRELWLQSLGLPAVLPPPEEVKHVETAIGAARAEKARKDLM